MNYCASCFIWRSKRFILRKAGKYITTKGCPFYISLHAQYIVSSIISILSQAELSVFKQTPTIRAEQKSHLLRLKALNRTAHRPEATEVLYYKAITQLTMAEWRVDAACPGFFLCGSLARNQISFQGGCLFLSYIYKQHYWVFFSPLTCQFKIAWCLYFPQLISHQFFWSVPASCSWRQLSSELVVTRAKEQQV